MVLYGTIRWMSTDEKVIVSRRRRTIDWRVDGAAVWVSARGGRGFWAAWRRPMGAWRVQPAPLLRPYRYPCYAYNGRWWSRSHATIERRAVARNRRASARSHVARWMRLNAWCNCCNRILYTLVLWNLVVNQINCDINRPRVYFWMSAFLMVVSKWRRYRRLSLVSLVD